jgi:poly(3-hydroxybutyrate) depolymerase
VLFLIAIAFSYISCNNSKSALADDTVNPIDSINDSTGSDTTSANDTAITDTTSSPFQPTLSLKPGVDSVVITQTISGENMDRKLYILSPQSIDEDVRYPILIVYHGAGGSGRTFLMNPNIKSLIDDGEFVGVYPSGYNNDLSKLNISGFWNLGKESTDADDVEFTDMIVSHLAEYKQLDTSRLYGMGNSNGAGMLNLLAKKTTYFRAIAPVVSQQTESTGDLTPVRAPAVYQFNGELDGLIPVDGGSSSVSNSPFLSATASALDWATYSRCNATPVATAEKWGNEDIEIKTYSGCEGGREIKQVVSLQADHGGVKDPTAKDVFYSKVWSFLKQH